MNVSFPSRLLVALLLLGSTAAVTAATRQENAALLWANGDRLPGKLLALDGSDLKWQSPFFEFPFVLDLDYLTSVDFPNVNRNARTRETLQFFVRGGDLLFGRLVGMTDGMVDSRSCARPCFISGGRAARLWRASIGREWMAGELFGRDESSRNGKKIRKTA